MRTNIVSARIAGVLFLAATASYMMGSGVINSVLNQPDFMSQLHQQRTLVTAGLLLEFINCTAVVGIAALLFPILKQHNESIAAAYMGSRLIEAGLLIAGMIFPLLLVTLSQEYSTAGESSSFYLTLGNIAIRGKEAAFELAMLALSLGSILFCCLLYRTKLIPRLLSLLGIVGYIALLVSSCFTMLGFEPGILLFIPGGIFELIFPIWLIVKGLKNYSS